MVLKNGGNLRRGLLVKLPVICPTQASIARYQPSDTRLRQALHKPHFSARVIQRLTKIFSCALVNVAPARRNAKLIWTGGRFFFYHSAKHSTHYGIRLTKFENSHSFFIYTHIEHFLLYAEDFEVLLESMEDFTPLKFKL